VSLATTVAGTDVTAEPAELAESDEEAEWEVAADEDEEESGETAAGGCEAMRWAAGCEDHDEARTPSSRLRRLVRLVLVPGRSIQRVAGRPGARDALMEDSGLGAEKEEAGGSAWEVAKVDDMLKAGTQRQVWTGTKTLGGRNATQQGPGL
jgi:hypothetical protein